MKLQWVRFYSIGFLFLTSLNGWSAAGVGINNGLSLSPKTGKKLLCQSQDVLKKDFLNQLYRHEVYGKPELVAELGQAPFEAAKYYQTKMADLYSKKKGPNLSANLFSTLTNDKVFDGSKLFSPEGDPNAVPQAGDVLLNMTFLNPYNAGSFYSKRGMIHARIVVGKETTRLGPSLVVLDGGWQSFSRLTQVHSQTVWLRPKANFFSTVDQDGVPSDKSKLVQWAKNFAPVPYDNRLIDNIPEFRTKMFADIDNALAAGGDPRTVQLASRKAAMEKSGEGQGFAPFNNPDTYRPESGFYCSEAGSDIFTYLGFRLYGEVPFDVVTAFSSSGTLPEWAVYENALGGFGADHGPVAMMHKLFFTYFSLLDAGWRTGLLPLTPEEKANYNFADTARKNQKKAEDRDSIAMNSDSLQDQLNLLISNSASVNPNLNAQAVAVNQKLQAVLVDLRNTYSQPGMNLTGAVKKLFFETKAYGPNHFLENGDYFELKGVFYNTDLESGYQAKWVADSDEGAQNASTTLYKIDPSADVAADGGCVVTDEALPGLPTQR